jgi:ABC-type multidrug transport system fused ATPase/permease subunit
MLWAYLRGFRLMLFLMLLLELLGHAATLAEPKVVQHVLDALTAHHSLKGPLIILMSIALGGLVLDAVAEFTLLRGSERLVRNARRTLVRRVMRSTVGAVERRPIGDFLSRIGSDTTMLEETVGGAIIHSASEPAALVGVLVLMATINLPMTGVVVAVLLFTTWAERFALYRIGNAIELAQERVAQMTSALQRALLAFRTVKASNTDRHEEAIVMAQADKAYAAGIKAAKAEVIIEIVSSTAMDVMFLAALAVGGWQVETHHLSVGGLVAFMLYVMSLDEPVDNLFESAGEIVEGMAAVRRLEDLRKLPVEEDLPHIPLEEAFDDGKTGAMASVCATCGSRRHTYGEHEASVIRLEDVWYAYDDKPVLRGVSFEASRGLTVLVGPSGAGKTTLLSLIERFVEIDQGKIALDGVDIRDLSRRDLRRRLAYVQQEAPLLGETIRDAALYGVPDTEHPYLEGALRDVALTDWVASLPDGLDTPVGERGVAISGGQRQRLAVARALLRGGDVLLLDEATSQLDMVNERTLLESLANQARNRTVIAVTHRLSVAISADQVLLIDSGRVRAAGSHAELMDTDEMYRDLVMAADAPLGHGNSRR